VGDDDVGIAALPRIGNNLRKGIPGPTSPQCLVTEDDALDGLTPRNALLRGGRDAGGTLTMTARTDGVEHRAQRWQKIFPLSARFTTSLAPPQCLHKPIHSPQKSFNPAFANQCSKLYARPFGYRVGREVDAWHRVELLPPLVAK
jgi:hypothetical protein